MNKTDRIIIFMLFIFLLSVGVISLALDKEIDAVNKTIDRLVKQQEITDRKVDILLESQAESDKRLSDIEDKQEAIRSSLVLTNDRIDILQTQVTQHEVQIKAIPTPKAETATTKKPGRYKVSVKLSESDIKLIAKLVYLEAGTESYKCQQAVASVVLNHMMHYKLSARGAIYRPGAFTVSGRVARATYSSSSLNAVRDVYKNGTTVPKNVLAFRTGHYHTFRGARRYCKIGNVYFSKV